MRGRGYRRGKRRRVTKRRLIFGELNIGGVAVEDAQRRE